MSDPVNRLATAEADAIAARERLSATVAMVQVRLNPKTLARQTARDVAGKSGELAQAGADTARRNPGALAGIVAVAGLFLARHRVAALFRRGERATRD